MAVSKAHIHGLLSAFPKLLSTNSQHSFEENENVRYVYLPVETLFVLIVTTKNSNIGDDLEVLKLLCQVVRLIS